MGDPGTIWDFGAVIVLPVDVPRVILGGEFTSLNGVTRNHVARLNSDGSLDTTFHPVFGADGTVYTVARQNDGAILIGGSFATFDTVSRNSIARLKSDGTLDATFNPGTGAVGPIYDIKFQTNGQALVAGDFTFYNSTPRKSVARLYLDGTLDTSFLDIYYNQSQPGTDPGGFINSLSVQDDGNVIVGGAFSSIGGGFTAPTSCSNST